MRVVTETNLSNNFTFIFQNYKKEEAGKVVVYTTTMGVVRETFQDCVLVKKILRNLMVKYEERDVFMSRETQTEIRERMGSDAIIVPQIFLEGQHIGVSLSNIQHVTQMLDQAHSTLCRAHIGTLLILIGMSIRRCGPAVDLLGFRQIRGIS